MAESYYAKIEGNEVVTVEVVTDQFFTSNKNRYTGKWIKVGEGSGRNMCSKKSHYIQGKNKIIEESPFPSWKLDSVTDSWKAPKNRPDQTYHWSEEVQDWIKSPRLNDKEAKNEGKASK